ncbi:MAG: metalloregulator ArsR/SmtB family transcription factor [Pseudomonadota bacterium]
MKSSEAVSALAALSHPTRLEVFRLLVRQGAIGLPAGQIATRLKVGPSTLSPHLAQLERSGLATSWRKERRIFYAINIDGTRDLIAFLTEDCCGGHPEICGYPAREVGHDDDLSQPELRDVAERSGDDPEHRRGADDHRVSEDSTES